TLIALLYALIPSVSSAYWILSVMTTQVYLIVYLLMFVAAVKLRQTQPDVERGYTVPALKFMCYMGFLASAAAVVIGFVPPSQFESGNTAAYVGIILAGTVLLGLLPPYLFLSLRKPDWQTAEGAQEAAPAAEARGHRPERVAPLDPLDRARRSDRARGDRPDHVQLGEEGPAVGRQGPGADSEAPGGRARRAGEPGHDHQGTRHRRRRRVREPAQRARAGQPVRAAHQRRLVRGAAAGDRRPAGAAGRGVDPPDLLPGEGPEVPEQGRRSEDRQRDQGLMTDPAGAQQVAPAAGPAAKDVDRPAGLGVLLAACISAFVVNANTSAVTILLPSISEDVHSSVAKLQWAVTGYSL